jgi:Mannose-6-phosphate isomerase
MNLFTLPAPLPAEELAELLIPDNGVRIERILSCGQTSPPGFWYDQDRDEWVVLLQGRAIISYPDGRQINLDAGDTLFLPAHEQHAVAFTSADPPCLWLAVHGKLK